MRVAVIGNRGFIGGHAERALAAAGYQVVGADRGEVEARVEDFQPQALIWAAGTRDNDPQAMRYQHVVAPLEAMALVPLDSFVYLSTGEVYGPQQVPFHETLEPQPGSVYSQAKLEGERSLAQAAAERGTRLTILRLPLAYGPGQGGKMFVPTLLAQLCRGERFPMTAGEQTRDFLFIDDVIAALLRVLGDDGAAGVFNIGSGVETRLIDIARLIARTLGGDAEALLEPGALPYREAEQMRYWLDVEHARQTLGFSPRVALEEGIRLTVEAAGS